MKVLLLSAVKPLFGLFAGVAFVSVPVSHERVMELERVQIEHMHELEQLERDAAGHRAREGAEPEEAPAEEGEKSEEAPAR